jgi:hypothetical protein
VNTTEQRLEGPVSNTLIQDFSEQEEVEKQQVKAAQAKLEAFEPELPREE